MNEQINQNELSVNNSSENKKPVKRVWRWYLILVIAYYSVSIILLILTVSGVDIEELLLRMLMVFVVWSIFNLGIFAIIMKSNIEKRALWIPGLIAFSVLGYSGIFSPLNYVILAFAIYMFVRR